MYICCTKDKHKTVKCVAFSINDIFKLLHGGRFKQGLNQPEGIYNKALQVL